MRLILLTLAVAAPAPAAKPDPAALAKRIDAHVSAKLKAAAVPPAARADDAAFLRRTHLLLAGRTPVPAEVHAFLEDRDPQKRAKLIDRLLASPAYANHFTTVWRGWLLPEAATRFEVGFLAPGFETWLRAKIAANAGYDKVVTELLTTPMGNSPNGVFGEDGERITTTPIAFYYAKDGKAENLAAASARLFLGVQLDCAQCHDHPFAKWSRDQFWGLAGFFGGVERTGPADNVFGPIREVLDRRELVIPNTDRVVQATFLDDTEPDWKPKTSGRVTLANWVTGKDNPFFARATANRMWGYVFGAGLVEPIDDFTDDNKPSHPELLDDLAKTFVASGFDLKFLLKAILLSDTYQRESGATDPGQADVRLFARFPVQPLTPEQLFDSLAQIASVPPESPVQTLRNPNSPRRRFLERFAVTGKRTEGQTSILQALTLMNGELVKTATDPAAGRPVLVVAELPGLTDAERVEILYLTALARKPTADESARSLKHVEGAPGPDRRKRYGDVLWALLNGVEFRTNH